jgi:hypothetical protein
MLETSGEPSVPSSGSFPAVVPQFQRSPASIGVGSAVSKIIGLSVNPPVSSSGTTRPAREKCSVSSVGCSVLPETPGPYPLFTLGRVLGYYPRGCFPKSLARRSPGYLPAVARLDAVLDPGGGGVTLVYIALAAWPASSVKDSARSKIGVSRGYVSDSGLHPSPRRTRYFSFLLSDSVISLPGG